MNNRSMQSRCHSLRIAEQRKDWWNLSVGGNALLAFRQPSRVL